MTLRDFSRLSEAGKDEMVLLWGDYVTDQVIPGQRVLLYRIDDFYVEVYYDFKEQRVKKFKGCHRSDLVSN